jgi:hypothetical protein
MVEWWLAGENRRTWWKPVALPFLSAVSLTWIHLGLNLGLSGEKPASIHLSCTSSTEFLLCLMCYVNFIVHICVNEYTVPEDACNIWYLTANYRVCFYMISSPLGNINFVLCIHFLFPHVQRLNKSLEERHFFPFLILIQTLLSSPYSHNYLITIDYTSSQINTTLPDLLYKSVPFHYISSECLNLMPYSQASNMLATRFITLGSFL